MPHGRTIKIFLIDGDPNGRLSCELSNWTGKAYKIPRIKIKDCADREDLRNTGVYFLFGKTEDGSDQIYIGEAESILTRLMQHLSLKEFWNEAIVLNSKDENLNKAHIKYLENRFYELAKFTNRYKVENSSTPTQSAISESDRAEMEEFLTNGRLLVNTLGHKVFEDKRETQVEKPAETFYIKAARGANAQGKPTSEGFVVFKDSEIANDTVKSMTNGLIAQRNKLIADDAIVSLHDKLILKEDIIFSSPSTAASIVLGRNANGWTEWKDNEGKTLKSLENNE